MKKRILALVALVLLFGGTTVAFAYWDNLNKTESETIVVGEGVTLTVNAVAEAPAGKVLVPSTAVLKANDVTEIVLTYNVKLDKTVLNDLNLSVLVENILINGAAANSELVNINIAKSAAVVNDTDVLVTVTVSLDEPADLATYSAIINQSITFDLVFTATQGS